MTVEWFGPARSLRRFQIRTSIGYTLLILVSGLLGLLGTRPWIEVSGEISRLAALEAEVQAIRGTLYRQVKEVFDDILLGDPEARREFGLFSQQIQGHFAVLDAQLRHPEEERLGRELQAAYGEVQRIGQTLMRNAQGRSGLAAPDAVERHAALQLMHTEIESGAFQRYEDVLARFEALLQREHREQTAQLAFLTRWVPAVLVLTLALAALLMAHASRYLRQHFTRPLAEVLEATRRIRRGELSHRVPARGAAELVDLAQGINAMAADLDASRQALVQSERQAALGALIPVVAHNIRNPLASIRATAQIADAPELPGETREALADIIGASDRLAAWTHALLSYLHPLQPQPQDCDLRQLAEQALALHASLLAGRGLRLRRAGWAQPAPLRADPSLLEQAISALLVNAVEASPPGGELLLSLDGDARQLWLGVVDQGPGWAGPPALQGLHRLPSTKPGGNGLGLPFCAKVCDSHGGRLDFLTPPGGGTEARIVLPRPPAASPNAAHAATPGRAAEPAPAAPAPSAAEAQPAAGLAGGAASAWSRAFASAFDRPRRLPP